MKTYSVCFLNQDKCSNKRYWTVNWYKNKSLDDFDYDKIEQYCLLHPEIKAYGYQCCEDSRNLHPKNITVLKRFEADYESVL